MDWSIIGLNSYEGKVFGALLRIGESAISELSKESGVPRNRVYEVLESLMSRGLANKTNVKPLRYSPEGVREVVDELLSKRKTDTKRFTKGLSNLEKEPKKIVDVRVYQGKDNWHRALRFLNKPIIKTSTDFEYSIRSIFKYNLKYVSRRRNEKRKGIKVERRSLGPITDKTKDNVKKYRGLGDKIKHFDNDMNTLRINNNGVVINLVNSRTTIIITDPYFTQMMKNLHEAAWKGL